EIGVAVLAQPIELLLRGVALRLHLVARDARREEAAAAALPAPETAAREPAQLRLEAVVVARCDLLAKLDLAHEARALGEALREPVVRILCARGELGERKELRQRRVDRGLARERRALPGRREVAVLDQAPERALEVGARTVAARARTASQD